MARSKKIKLQAIRKFQLVDRDTDGEITSKRIVYPDEEISVTRKLAGMLIGSNKAIQIGISSKTDPDDILPRPPSDKVFSASSPGTGVETKETKAKAAKK